MKKLSKITPDNEGMKTIGMILKEILPENMGFTLLTFNFGDAGLCNYISDANREDMIKSLRETADRLEFNRGIIQTPNQN